jgi:hypothetical protein
MANEVEMLQKARDQAGNPYELTYAHGAVHKDTIINASNVQAANTGDILYFIKTPNDPTKQVHLTYNVRAAGDCEARFYRAPAVNAQGTAMTTTRLHDSSVVVTGAAAYFGGTVTGANYGTLLKEQFNGGAGMGGNISGGSSVHEDAEFLLRLDTWYCLRLTRAASQKLAVEFEWYEVPA